MGTSPMPYAFNGLPGFHRSGWSVMRDGLAMGCVRLARRASLMEALLVDDPRRRILDGDLAAGDGLLEAAVEEARELAAAELRVRELEESLLLVGIHLRVEAEGVHEHLEGHAGVDRHRTRLDGGVARESQDRKS